MVQTGVLLSTFAILVLTFLSYVELTLHNPKELLENPEPVPNQIFLPVFALVYYTLSRWHNLRFWPSSLYMPLSFFLVGWTFVPDFGTLFLSISGRILFCCMSGLNLLLAHEEELSSRKRFRAQRAVKETQTRTETILNTLMPPLVVRELRESCIKELSHKYQAAIVAQSDLCGFTKLAATRTPNEVVDFISDLFGRFDELTEEYGIYKVETVGDAYIAGQAEKPLTEENKPVNVVSFGLDMVTAVEKWSRALGGERVSCRVGIHYGECIGGIVGTDMQRYHLFGGLMSVVEVLESTGKEALVQLSPACKDAVEKSMQEHGVTNFSFVKRTDADLRTSKGEKHDYEEVGGVTYFVHRRTGLETVMDDQSASPK